MIVVSDASPVISLATIGRLDLLHALYGSVAIPEAVRGEVLSGDRPGSAEVAAASWIEVRAVQNTLFSAALGVGRGEGEAIMLAIELKADRLVADERQARRIATRFGVETIGVAGLLVEARRAGLIPSVAPILDELASHAGFRFSERLRRGVLESVGESDE